ncbi:hypothetical protein BJ742DRAFT_799076 [Cladochytrium replicatum]|nr:hypothetical protein BJ742DRAFT_799076 [Cladochytrium replicatum]
MSTVNGYPKEGLYLAATIGGLLVLIGGLALAGCMSSRSKMKRDQIDYEMYLKSAPKEKAPDESKNSHEPQYLDEGHREEFAPAGHGPDHISVATSGPSGYDEPPGMRPRMGLRETPRRLRRVWLLGDTLASLSSKGRAHSWVNSKMAHLHRDRLQTLTARYRRNHTVSHSDLRSSSHYRSPSFNLPSSRGDQHTDRDPGSHINTTHRLNRRDTIHANSDGMTRTITTVDKHLVVECTS